MHCQVRRCRCCQMRDTAVTTAPVSFMFVSRNGAMAGFEIMFWPPSTKKRDSKGRRPSELKRPTRVSMQQVPTVWPELGPCVSPDLCLGPRQVKRVALDWHCPAAALPGNCTRTSFHHSTTLPCSCTCMRTLPPHITCQASEPHITHTLRIKPVNHAHHMSSQ